MADELGAAESEADHCDIDWELVQLFEVLEFEAARVRRSLASAPLGTSTVITRSQWGARPPRSISRNIKPLGVALHYEGPKMGTFPHTSCATKVRGIQAFHMDSRGWSDIAYSELVCPHGFIFEGRGFGVRSAANGTNEGNDTYYAVCGLWGVDDAFTSEAKSAYVSSIQRFRTLGGAGSSVKPHSFFKATACPGDPVRGWIAAGSYEPAPTPPDPDLPPIPQEDDVQYRAIQRVEDKAVALVKVGWFDYVNPNELDAMVAGGLCNHPADEVNAVQWDRIKAYVHKTDETPAPLLP